MVKTPRSTPIQKEIKEQMESILARAKEDDDAEYGVGRTGLNDVERMSGGFRAKELSVVAGLPGCGATTFALQMALKTAMADTPVWVCSTQISEDVIASRLAHMRKAIGTPPSEPEFDKYLPGLEGLPLYIAGPGVASVGELEAEINESSANMGHNTESGLVIVDGVFLRAACGIAWQGNVVEGNSLAFLLKGMAERLNMSVVIVLDVDLTALNKPQMRPGEMDLRWLGSAWIEEAVSLLYVHRLRLYAPEDCIEEDGDIVEIIVVQNRFGSRGTVRVRFDEEGLSFDGFCYD